MNWLLGFLKKLNDSNSLLTVLLLALLLRLVNLDQSFWLDEAAHAIQSAQPLTQQLQLEKDIHPPLGYILVHFWMYGGSREWYLRLTSVFTGVGTVWLTYLIGKKISPSIGTLSAFFLAISPYHIYYSQELRMYSLATFLAALLIYSLLTNRWILHILALTAGFYTLYLFPLMLVAEVIYFFTEKPSWFKPWTKSCFVSLMLFIPWLPQLWQQLQGSQDMTQAWPTWQNISSPNWLKALPLTYAKFIFGRISFANKFLYGILVLSSLLITLPLFYKSLHSKSHPAVKLVFYWLIIPIFSAWLISFRIPVNGPWRLTFTLPAFYLLLAVGNGAVKSLAWKKFFIAGVTVISLLGLMTYYLNPQFQREDWRTAVSVIQAQAALSEQSPALITFAFTEPFAPYRWYADSLKNATGLLKNLVVNESTKDKLNQIIDGKKTIFHFEYLSDLTDPQRQIPKWVTEKGYTLNQIHNFHGVGFVYEYQRLIKN